MSRKISAAVLSLFLVACASEHIIIHPSAVGKPAASVTTFKAVVADKAFKRAVIVGLYDVAKMQDLVQPSYGDAFFGTEPTQITVPSATYVVFVRCENMYEIPIVNVQVAAFANKIYTASCYRTDSQPFARIEVTESARSLD